jgi:hypothetical protein
VTSPTPTHSQPCFSSKPLAPSTTSATATSAASSPSITGGKTPTTLLLSPAEIADHQAKGLYFHCNDKFTNGHREKCKQLFLIEVICEEDERPTDDEQPAPTISLHALTGIQPRSGCTIRPRHGERHLADGVTGLRLHTQLHRHRVCMVRRYSAERPFQATRRGR